MKKLLLFSTAFITFMNFALAQLSEGFEGGTFPPTGWTSFIGTNGLGTNQNWTTTSTANTGTTAAFVRYDFGFAGTAEDWLVTPQVTPTANDFLLSFFQRQSFGTNFGSIYTVRVSTASQTNHGDFTIIDTQTEDDFGTTYTEHTVDLTAYIGTPIYIAFVMENNDGDDWYIDDVNLGDPPPPPFSGETVNCGTPLNQTHCYDNFDNTTFGYVSSDGTSLLNLTFNAGGIEACCDFITIYDGSDNTAPILFQGANGGNLAGLSVTSTGTNLFMTISSDVSVSCQSGSFCCTTQWDWDVVCEAVSTCPEPTAFMANNVTTNSADLTWTPGGSCTAPGEYWVLATGSAVPTLGTGATVACPAVLPVMVSSLISGTTYDVWVYEDCGANGTAGPANIGSFTTLSGGIVNCGTPLNQTHCYDNFDDTTFGYVSSDGTSPLTLTFNEGGIESCCDFITIYDGLDNTGSILFQGNNGGDLAGVMVTSTGANLFMTISSDVSISCQSGSSCCTTQWDWDVECPFVPTCELIINEVDYDQPSSDDAEFIEIYNPCDVSINLDDYTIELVNGSGASVYTTINLPDVDLAAGDYYVICANGSSVPNCDLQGFSSIQNGAPDAIGLRNNGALVDAVSYEGNVTGYTEGDGTGLEDPGTAGNDDISISRLPNGTDTDVNNADFGRQCATPGATNDECPAEPTELAIAADDADKAEGNSGTTAFTFTVTRSGDVSGANDVDYAVTGSGSDPADADDFGGSLPSGTVMFAATETSQTITVNVSGDLDIEATEFFTITLSNPTNGANIPTATDIGRIQNDDGLSCPEVGDLIITEIMQNPNAVNDSDGEYFEVWNSTDSPINMDGMTIQDDGSNSHEISGSVIVPASGFVVFGINADFATNGGVTVDYEYSGFTLGNSDDEVVIVCQGVVLDAVDYDGGPEFPDPTGAAMSLDPGSFNSSDNDDGANWCEATTTYGDGDFGTPGEANPACPVVAAELVIAVDDADKDEGDAGNTAFTFTVTRSVNTSGSNDVDWAVTGNGGDPANADDFGGSLPSGTVMFTSGETSMTITVNVSGDTDVEADEGFTVTLSNATNGATITTAAADGTIRNDDCVLQTWYADTDGDSFGDPNNSTLACEQPSGFVDNADDCDDTMGEVNPEADEICNGIDDNCDGNIDEGVLLTFYEDFDGDGFGNGAVTQMACSAPNGYVDNADDCDDTNGAVNPEADEICDGIDNDCDGTTDENPVIGPEWFADTDGDGFGDAENSVIACTQPAGFVANDLDCDDTNGAINPNADEICNGIDDDCDGMTDEFAVDAPTWYEDSDGDGFGNQNVVLVQCDQPVGYVSNLDDCDDTNADINPNTIWYADIDGDGFGNPESSVMTCDPGAGFVMDDNDCDDNAAAVNPDAEEVCNGIDDNCDGNIDEGVLSTFYADTDSDGFGDPNVTTMACSAPAGFVADNTDCDDTNMAVNPGAVEVCNGIDDDCDGMTDEGVTTTYYADTDGDGFGDPANTTQACSLPSGFVTNADDCNDTNMNVNPNAMEVCGNAIDDNCDGQVDEGCDCTVASVSVSNISDCNDNGTNDPFDDTFTADVTVTFSNIPQTGSLNLTGDGMAAVAVSNINGNSHTFFGVPMSADADAIGLTASFSADPNCTLTNGNAGIAPAPCSGTCEVEIIDVIVTDETCPGYGDGTITIIATASGQEGYSINGGASFQFDNVFTNLTPGMYDIVVQVYGDPSCMDDATAQVMPPPMGALQTWYQDFDGDGYSPGNTVQACDQPAGYELAEDLTSINGDCNDYDPLENVPQDWYLDGDGDGYGVGTGIFQCERPANHYLASELTSLAGDCDDNDPAINPGAPELCNGIDDNCNGEVDEGAAGGLTYVGNVFLPNQAAVDAFSQCYSIIDGSLTIQNGNVTDLSNLINLEEVTGNVSITGLGANSLDGLNNLTTIGGNFTLRLNHSITDLDALYNLSSVGGNLNVSNNNNLSDCCGIYDLINNGGVGGSITIRRNDTGCDNVSEINTACVGGASLGTPNGGNTNAVQSDLQQLSVYPNPMSDVLTVNLTKDFETGSLRILDLQGRMIYGQEIGAGNLHFKLSIDNLVPGMYLLHVIVDGENFTERLMVK